MESIRPIRGEELDRLKPLWLALQDHHMRISPRLADLPKRSPDESWRRRHAKYAHWLERPGTFVLVAERDDDLVGYAFVTIEPGYASWDSGDQLAELETLSIAPAARGQRVGSRLVAAVRARLASDGITQLAVTSAITNVGSHRFYERHGFNKAHTVFVGPTNLETGLAQQ